MASINSPNNTIYGIKAYFRGLGVESPVRLQFLKRHRIQTEGKKLSVQTIDVGLQAGEVDRATIWSTHGGTWRRKKFVKVNSSVLTARWSRRWIFPKRDSIFYDVVW